MAKTLKRKPPKTLDNKTSKSPIFIIPDKYLDLILPSILVIILVLLLKPLVIDGLSPQGVDVLGSIGQKNQVSQYYKETGIRALWNPYVFSGMPTYQRLDPVAPSIDTIIRKLSPVFSNVFLHYLIAALGMYLLLRVSGMSPLISFISTSGFVLIPHYKSLWLEGHYTKFRALMMLPWIVLAFRYFELKRTLFSGALFALAFGLQIRTQHYQIIFYSGVLIFSIGLYPFIKDLMEKNWIRFSKSTLILLGAIILALAMAAQPMFLAREYLPYSKRGKTTINLNDTKQVAAEKENAGGVTLEYATQWSTHPSEMFTWIIPRFYGGMSQENYKGDQVREFRNRDIPGYWGHMPFTQSYEYAGVLIMILAVFGFYAQRKNYLIISLSVFSLFLILLSFGKHFSIFYSIFYYHLPFFNKFRAPMMSVTVNYFIFCLLAAYGLSYLKNLVTGGELFKNYRNEFIIMGSFLLLGIIVWLAGQSFTFTKPGGEGYEAQVIDRLKIVRSELFFQDLYRYLLFVVAFIVLIILYLRKKINFIALGICLALFVVIDNINIHNRVHKKLQDKDKIKRVYFAETQTDKFISSDKELFRVLPAGQLFGRNRWAYFHQTIGGYSPIKMSTIEELIENNLYNGWEKSFPINWNVLRMLNVKYVVLQGKVENAKLELVHGDPNAKLFTYRYKNYLGRGFFPQNYQVIKDPRERLEALNKAEYDPQKLLILEEDLEMEIGFPDSSSTKVMNFEPNQVEFEIYSDKTSLFVISELYYPPGWKIYLDNELVGKIYKSHHALQSLIVPMGKHTLRMEFSPDSYTRNLRYAYISIGLIYLIILTGLGQRLYLKIKK